MEGEVEQRKRRFSSKVKWSEQERRRFLELVPLYGTHYGMYTQQLGRSYSCVKGFFHSLKKQGALDQKTNAALDTLLSEREAETPLDQVDADDVLRQVMQMLELL